VSRSLSHPSPAPTDRPRVSVVVVVHDRAEDAAACLDSLRSQSFADFEVRVVLNDPSPAVEAVLEDAARRDARIRVVRFGGGSASAARNAGVWASTAPVLYFVDDDVCVPRDGLAALLDEMDARPEIAVLGGPNLTPPGDPPFAQMTGALLGSRWGSGITQPRYSPSRPGPARERDLILCNLAVRRSVFERGIVFPALFGGEENVLMGHAEHRGMALWYSPRVWVFHRRRHDLRGYLKQVYRYGWGRANAVWRAPRTAHPAYFVPVAFLAYLLGLPLLAVGSVLFWLPLGAYGVGTVVAATRIALRHRRPGWLLPLLALFPATHVTYAVGLCTQLVRLGWTERRSAEPVPA